MATSDRTHSSVEATREIYDLLKTKLIRNGDRVSYIGGWTDEAITKAARDAGVGHVNEHTAARLRQTYFGHLQKPGLGPRAKLLPAVAQKEARSVPTMAAPFRTLPERLEALETKLGGLKEAEDVSDLRASIISLRAAVEGATKAITDLTARLDYLEQALGGR